jgi:hypothetical protein
MIGVSFSTYSDSLPYPIPPTLSPSQPLVVHPRTRAVKPKGPYKIPPTLHVEKQKQSVPQSNPQEKLDSAAAPEKASLSSMFKKYGQLQKISFTITKWYFTLLHAHY